MKKKQISRGRPKPSAYYGFALQRFQESHQTTISQSLGHIKYIENKIPRFYSFY